MSDAAAADATPAAGADGDAAAAAPAAAAPVSADAAAAPAAGDQAAAAEGGKADAPALPDTYTFTVPDGVEMDASALEAFQPIAKELGLDQAGAQKLVDLVVDMRQREAAAFDDQSTQWAAECRALPDIGGDKFDESLAAATKVIEKFGDDNLKALLNTTKFGNHPAFFRFTTAIAKAISDDAFVGGRPAPPQKTAAQRMYPTMQH